MLWRVGHGQLFVVAAASAARTTHHVHRVQVPTHALARLSVFVLLWTTQLFDFECGGGDGGGGVPIALMMQVGLHMHNQANGHVDARGFIEIDNLDVASVVHHHEDHELGML